MILRNYNNFINGLDIGANNQYKAILRDVNNEMKKYDSTASYTADIPNLSASIFNKLTTTLSDKGTGVFVGNGSTPPTQGDYKLESMIEYKEDGLTVVSKTVSKAVDEDTTLLYVYTLKNNSSDPITVSEVGLFIHTAFTYYYAGDHINEFTIMIARNVIDPEVLEPGQIKSFTVAIGS